MMAKAKEENRYHDKHMEAPLYAAVLTIWRRYATEDMLRQSHHPYWCQKSESLNQLVTVFAPKDKHLSASMSLSDRVSLVVIVDSVGFAQGVCEIMEEIGCDVPASTIECLKRRDAKREYDKMYKNKIENRRRRGEQIRQKIKEALENRKNDKKNGFKYKPSIAVTGDTAVETSTKKRRSRKRAVPSGEVNDTAIEKKKRAKRTPVICPLWGCQQKGHVTAKSKYCFRNPNHPKYDPNLVPPPTSKFHTYLHTVKNLQKRYKLLTYMPDA